MLGGFAQDVSEVPPLRLNTVTLGSWRYWRNWVKISDLKFPSSFFTDRYVLYANYWVMQKALFERYMEWSWPKVEWCLHHRNTNPFLGNPCPADFQAAALNGSDVRGKSAGYVMERLFIIWYMLNKVRINRLGPLLRF